MKTKEAINWLETLAAGKEPKTTRPLPPGCGANRPSVTGALLRCAQLLRSHHRPPLNAGRRWTLEEEARLVAGDAVGKDARELCRELGRSEAAVRKRMRSLGLDDKLADGTPRRHVGSPLQTSALWLARSRERRYYRDAEVKNGPEDGASEPT